eukprot:9062007-Ditylum_brightwellii.AAC.1
MQQTLFSGLMSASMALGSTPQQAPQGQLLPGIHRQLKCNWVALQVQLFQGHQPGTPGNYSIHFQISYVSQGCWAQQTYPGHQKCCGRCSISRFSFVR